MANTNMNRQVIDIRTSAGVGDISNEILRRWSEKGYNMAVKEGNYDRSREHLNFEVVKGGRTRTSVLPCSSSSAVPMTV